MRKLRNLAGLVAALALLSGTLPNSASAQGAKQAMLAVIERDGNVAIYDAEGKNPFAVTTDADGQTRAYQWVTWSTDGRLAFFGVSIDPLDPYTLRAYVLERPQRGEMPKVAYTATEDVFTYAYWSPADCPAGNCRDLALLYTAGDGSGLAVKMIRAKAGQYEEILVGRASPFYYSFSPDGQKMIWHRFSRLLEVYDVAGNEVELILDDVPGTFQSPMWSPKDNRLLFAVRGSADELSDVVIADGDARSVLLSDQPAPVSMAWSPDAEKVAIVSGFEKLQVVDTLGNVMAESAQGQVVGHFWSPDSTRVAYISLVPSRSRTALAQFSSNGHSDDSAFPESQQSNQLTWYVLDIVSGTSTALTSFTPTPQMVYYLNFFDQFSRSHSLWSPDSTYLVYGAIENGAPAVLLANTRQAGTTVRVSDGVMGVWSWQ